MKDPDALLPSLALPLAIAVPDVAGDWLSQRTHLEPSHPYRSAFVRDIGRILHAKAFRRLALLDVGLNEQLAAGSDEPRDLGEEDVAHDEPLLVPLLPPRVREVEVGAAEDSVGREARESELRDWPWRPWRKPC